MRLRLHLILYILSALPLTVSTAYGQDNTSRQIYNQAEVEYDIGQLDQAITTLRNGMNSFEGTIRQSAYRLMALCWLALDEPGVDPETTERRPLLHVLGARPATLCRNDNGDEVGTNGKDYDGIQPG